MRQTVVGVFERYTEAQRAAQQLRDAGFADSVTVTERQDDTDADSGTAADRTSASRPEDEGVLASVRNFFSSIFSADDDEEMGAYAEAVRRGGGVVKVEVEDDSDVDAARAALVQAGAMDLDERATEWGLSGTAAAGARLSGAGLSGAGLSGGGLLGTGASDLDDDRRRSSGTTGLFEDDTATSSTFRTGQGVGGAAATPSAGRDLIDDEPARSGTSEEDVVPVVREELQVGKRTVSTGGVRIYARTVETPVSETVSLRSERAVVDRRPVDRPATQADLDGLRESTIEVRETTEQPVVAKEARVIEEVRVGKVVEHRTEEVRDTVRNTEVSVESIDADDAGDDDAGGDDFRSHFQSRLASSGGEYEDYEPAYRYGRGLRGDARYSGRSWEDIEPDLRRDWESSNPGSAWDRFKSAVRHGWDRMTG